MKTGYLILYIVELIMLGIIGYLIVRVLAVH